jgi:hypothetical protein
MIGISFKSKLKLNHVSLLAQKSLLTRSLRYFSGDHGHSHAETVEEVYHERKYNRISYNKKLKDSERER